MSDTPRARVSLGFAVLAVALLVRGLLLGAEAPPPAAEAEHRTADDVLAFGPPSTGWLRVADGVAFPGLSAGALAVATWTGGRIDAWRNHGPGFRPDRADAILVIRLLAGFLAAAAAAGLAGAARRWSGTIRARARPGIDGFLDPLRPAFRIAPWLAGLGLAVLPAALGARGAESLALLLIVLWWGAAARYRAGSSTAVLALGGFALGVAAATRIGALVLLPWHLILPATGRRFRSGGAWLAALLAPALGFALTRPGLFAGDGPFHAFRLTPHEAWATAARTFLAGDPAVGIAPILAALAVIGTVAVLFRADRGGWWLAGACWGSWAAALAMAPESGATLLAVPGLLLAAGIGIDALAGPVARPLGTPPGWLAAVTAGLLLLPQILVTGARILNTLS